MIKPVEAYEYDGRIYRKRKDALIAELRETMLTYKTGIGYIIHDLKDDINFSKVIEICKELVNETENN